jgi:hypothetical protein
MVRFVDVACGAHPQDISTYLFGRVYSFEYSG